MRYATDTFGDTRIDRIDPQAIGAWRKRLPERSAWAILKTVRQVLHYAVRVKLLDENPASLVPNPEPKRREVLTFTDPGEVDAVAAELDHRRYARSCMATRAELRALLLADHQWRRGEGLD